MLAREPLLVTLVKLVDLIPMPQEPEQRGRGRPKVYSDRIMVKALIIMVVRRLYIAYSLLAFLEQETELTKQFRHLCQYPGAFPEAEIVRQHHAERLVAHDHASGQDRVAESTHGHLAGIKKGTAAKIKSIADAIIQPPKIQ